MTGEITQLQNFHNSGILNLRASYSDRVDQWTPALRNVGSAFERASDNFRQTLTAAGKEATARRDFYFSILTLAAGINLRWIGIWASSRLSSTALSEGVQTYLSGAAQQGVTFAVNQGITGVRNTVDTTLPSLEIGTNQFQNTLLNQLDNKKNSVKSMLSTLANSVHRQDSWARDMLAQAGSLQRAKTIDRRKEAELEREWFGSCYYYMNAPTGMSNVIDMSRKLERGLWSIWVRTNIRAGIRVHRERLPPGYEVRERREQVYTNPEEATLSRLEELRIIAPANESERSAIRRRLETAGGTWREGFSPSVPNFGWRDDYDDVTRLITWSRQHDIEPIGNLPPQRLEYSIPMAGG